MLKISHGNSVVLVVALLAGAVQTIWASETYEPLFSVDLAAEFSPRGSIAGDYLQAADSETSEIAIQRWEVFLSTHSYGTPVEVEDLTHLHFVRLANLELLRLYYIQGRISDADKLLRRIEDLTVYSSPYIEGGKQWCRIHGYCR